MQNIELLSTKQTGRFKAPARLKRMLTSFSSSLPTGTAFELELGDERMRIGEGQVEFRVSIHNRRALSALSTMDERRIGEAYLDGDISIEGNLVAALNLRKSLTDHHWLFRLWSTYGQKLFFGQVSSDKEWIRQHYDNESDFYLLFLDKEHRCYSHGYFDAPDEPLHRAIQRKLDTAIEACAIQPGWRVLDIGAGWGAFTEHAGKQGVRVTSLTISAESERYVNELIARKQLPCEVVCEHLLEYRAKEPYDAIVNLGVTEHLPDYPATLAQYQRLLKPGGRVFLDACASRVKYSFSSFVLSHVWPGNTTPLDLAGYMTALADTPFELIYARNDRNNYLLTTKHWAENLDRHRDEIVAKWGERWYRRFRLYLWGCVHSFASDDVTAYRLLLELPSDSRSRKHNDASRFSRSRSSLAARMWKATRSAWRFPRGQRG